MDSLSRFIASRNSTDMQLLERYERGDVSLGEDIGYRLKHLAQALKVELVAAPPILNRCVVSTWMFINFNSSLFNDFYNNLFNWSMKLCGGAAAFVTTCDVVTRRLPEELVPRAASRHFKGAFSPQQVLRHGTRMDIEQVRRQITSVAALALGGLVATAAVASVVWGSIGVVWALPPLLLVSAPLVYGGLRGMYQEGLPGTLDGRLGTLEVFPGYQFTMRSAVKIVELAISVAATAGFLLL